jgi:hypothetical protein
MPIQFQCQSCRSTLQVPDNLAGRKVRCPKCRGVADVNATSAASPAAMASGSTSVAANEKASPRFRPDPEEVRVRPRMPAPAREPEVEDAEEVEGHPSRPARAPSRREEAISTRPSRRNEPADTEDEEEEEARAKTPRPRRFKRRRKRPKKHLLPGGWGWVRWAVAGAFTWSWLAP